MASLLKWLGLASPGTRVSPAIASASSQLGECIIVDVREPDELTTTGVAPGSVVVSLGDPEFEGKVAALSKQYREKSIALMCRSGMRSVNASKRLHKHGVEDSQIIVGGMLAWEKLGLPLEAVPKDR